MDEVDTFIRNYSTKDRDRVVFASNGSLGPDLRDANIEHRLAVCDKLRKTGASPASDELIRELYDAETAWAKAAWCVRHDTVSFLAAELLTRNGERNLRHYLECCMFRGMDAYMSSLCVELSPEVRSKVVAGLAALIDSEGASAPSHWANIRDNLAGNPAAE
jgi:hypothetical protein